MTDHCLLTDVLPTGAEGAECFGDLVSPGAPPDELAAVRSATAVRIAEFSTVRVLAHRAMERLAPEARQALASHALVPDARGAPKWPAGIVGSLTHTGEYRAALVARARTYASIGLDAELNRDLPVEVRELICRPEERAMIETLERGDPNASWACVVFSAKESIYKAWYPLMGTWLDYDDISVRIDTKRRTFRARLMGCRGTAGSSKMARLRGAWSTSEVLTVTTAVLKASAQGRKRRR